MYLRVEREKYIRIYNSNHFAKIVLLIRSYDEIENDAFISLTN